MFKRYLIWSAVIHLILFIWAGARLPSPSSRLEKTVLLEIVSSGETMIKSKKDLSQADTEKNETGEEKKKEDLEALQTDSSWTTDKRSHVEQGNIRDKSNRGRPLGQSVDKTNKDALAEVGSTNNELREDPKEPQEEVAEEREALNNGINIDRPTLEQKTKEDLDVSKDFLATTNEQEEFKKTEETELDGPDSGTREETRGQQTEPDQLPILISKKNPFYPLLARRKGWEGSVILEIQLKKDGSVGEVRLINSSGHEILDEEAKKAVREWVYKPAYISNSPIDYSMKVKITFALND